MNPGITHASLLSELHLQEVGGHEWPVAGSAQELAPDLIVLTGDTIDRADRLDVLDEFLSLLPNHTPTYAVLDNWEHWARVILAKFAKICEAHEARLLVNQGIGTSVVPLRFGSPPEIAMFDWQLRI